MAVKFKVIERGNTLKPTLEKKHYAIAVAAGETTLKQIGKRISLMSTVNSGDVRTVLDLLVQVMNEELNNGNIVRLGNFGSFQVSISANGQDSADKVIANSVRYAKINFRPGKDLRDMLTTASYEKV